MPKPNNIYKHSNRVMDMVIEEIGERKEMQELFEKLKAAKLYDRVRITSYKSGAKPRYDKFTQTWSKQYYMYAVRCYNYPNKN